MIDMLVFLAMLFLICDGSVWPGGQVFLSDVERVGSVSLCLGYEHEIYLN